MPATERRTPTAAPVVFSHPDTQSSAAPEVTAAERARRVRLSAEPFATPGGSCR